MLLINQILLLFLSTMFIACNSEQPVKVITGIQKEEAISSSELKSDKKSTFQFSLDVPDRVLILPNELIEVSGLSYNREKNQLLAINDEKGFLYSIDRENGNIVSRDKFAGKGDYEGVELCNNTVYIIRSDGDIVKYYPDKMESEKRRETILSQVNDVEGLGYDHLKESLIIACKGSPIPGRSSGDKSEKAIFAYNLDHDTIENQEVLKISDRQLLDFFDANANTDNMSRSAHKRYKTRVTSFSPSAIAMHPVTGRYFILSSVGKLLVILSNKGSVEWIEFLDSKIHYQPEGICFDSEGGLYISNEGKNLKAKIFYFELK